MKINAHGFIWRREYSELGKIRKAKEEIICLLK